MVTFLSGVLLAASLVTPAGPDPAGELQVAAGELQVAQLGDCRLESGAMIRDCRVGYRVVGELNAERSNAILFPTWFGGTSGDLLNFLGPGGLLDPAHWYVIVVDALGNGVSSSPSNSPQQSDATFPAYTIPDMVAIQHRLLTEELGLHQVHAVMGISMGGMQALQWSVDHPDFLVKAVSVVGTPWLTTWDRLYWGGMARILEECLRRECDNPGGLFNLMAYLGVYTPEERERRTPRSEADDFMSSLESQGSALRPWDILSQIRAMQPMDITARFQGSLWNTAKSIRADVMVAVATRDLTVRPEPSMELARALDAESLVSDSACGHQFFVCDMTQVGSAVEAFLVRERIARP